MKEEDCLTVLEEALITFKQAEIHTSQATYFIQQRLGAFSFRKKKSLPTSLNTAHNRSKKHLLPEGIPDQYLIGLGLMGTNGKVNASQAHKFRQINRFLELVVHTLNSMPEGRPFHIVDMGCGKAYLTFALYHYLREVKGIDVELTGVDRRADVIAGCRELAETLGYHGLHFVQSDIESFTPSLSVDAVVSLHACDTATDDALAKALEWNTQYIFVAPCCQHELYNQVQSEELGCLLKHGILKERFAALVTDAARAELLNANGYKTQIVEFIDLEHSPKNLLIRAEKGPSDPRAEQAKKNYRRMKDALRINPKLENLLSDFPSAQ